MRQRVPDDDYSDSDSAFARSVGRSSGRAMVPNPSRGGPVVYRPQTRALAVGFVACTGLCVSVEHAQISRLPLSPWSGMKASCSVQSFPSWWSWRETCAAKAVASIALVLMAFARDIVRARSSWVAKLSGSAPQAPRDGTSVSADARSWASSRTRADGTEWSVR